MGNYKIFYIKTYGCQMNVGDTTRISNILIAAGFEETFLPELAEIYIFNTCSVRENARNKVLSDIGNVQKMYSHEKIIAVGGCVGAQEGHALVERNYKINIVFGHDQISSLPTMLRRVIEKNKRVVDITKNKTYSYGIDEIRIRRKHELTPSGTAFVSIIQGCNNFCSYCVVPYARGSERSRSMNEIIEEVKYHLDQGSSEIFLLGQNVNAYGKDINESFVKLLTSIDKLNPRRLRFMTSHPKDVDDNLIDAFFDLKSLCHYLHLPVQAGSNKVLSAMNRRYSKSQYMSIIEKFRKKKADFAFGTDLIVGFPGEEETDFTETLDLMKNVKYEVVFSFKYSPRPGTKAYLIQDSVPLKTKVQRLAILNDLNDNIYEERAKSLIGKTYEVMVEGKSKYPQTNYCGRTSEFRYVNFIGDNEMLLGKYVKVLFKSYSASTYIGELVI